MFSNWSKALLESQIKMIKYDIALRNLKYLWNSLENKNSTFKKKESW